MDSFSNTDKLEKFLFFFFSSTYLFAFGIHTRLIVWFVRCSSFAFFFKKTSDKRHSVCNSKHFMLSSFD